MSSSIPSFGHRGQLPPAYDAGRVAHAIETLQAGLREQGERALADRLGDRKLRKLLAAVFGNSPFLTRLALKDPLRFMALVSAQPGEALDAICAGLRVLGQECRDFATLQHALRVAKREAALVIALADIGGAWPLETVTTRLTAFADAAIQAAVHGLLRLEVGRGALPPPSDPKEPGAQSGLMILAMGKYGAGELNYSSDVDLIVFFDPLRFRVPEGQDAQSVAVRVTRNLVRALSDQTGDGYVFRTDLRLRPDAGATQVALSTEAAELYYESMGQNWERAAMIKARACAGDLAAGAAFLDRLKPFIWRKYLDFAAIEDIHSIKRQIHAHGGHGEVAVAGHNIKLGRGGIREIEFFVQTQQLILGGRDPTLRGRTTRGMLARLAERGLVAGKTARELDAAYVFLRQVEHRLQMIEDAQTHTIPIDPAGLDHIARFCGYDKTGAFEQALTQVLRTVQTHYAALFESAPPLTEAEGSLVFTGVEDDPETLETLTRLGFARAGEVAAHIRSWHHGRLRATRSARARELLTKLVPPLLSALARTGDPDTAFFRFHTFLEGLPAGVQLFSLLLANPALLSVLAESLGTAPRLAHYLARHTAVIDAMLDGAFAARLPGEQELAEGLERGFAEARDFQDTLDVARRFAHEQTFRVGFQILSNGLDPLAAGTGFTRVAEAVLTALLPATRQAVVERHGKIEAGTLAVIGMGKLGGREMTAASDLDLIFIYDCPDDARSNGARSNGARSDGARALTGGEYYARIAQRLINAITVPTAEGKLYDVDMRLRPSGNAGPVATQLRAFERYQAEAAWTWEKMALTRSRVVAGDDALAKRVTRAVRDVLTRPRDQAVVARDVVDMRNRLIREHPSEDPWELKQVRGGLIDLEFIAQFLILVHAPSKPEILATNTREQVRNLAQVGALGSDDAQTLEHAFRLVHAVLQVLRMAVEGPFEPAEAAPGLEALLCRVSEEPTLLRLERALVAAQADVHRLFNTLVEASAR